MTVQARRRILIRIVFDREIVVQKGVVQFLQQIRQGLLIGVVVLYGNALAVAQITVYAGFDVDPAGFHDKGVQHDLQAAPDVVVLVFDFSFCLEIRDDDVVGGSSFDPVRQS